MLILDQMLNIHCSLPLKWNLPVLETATTFSIKEADVICQSECYSNTNYLSCLYQKRKQVHVKQWGMEDKMWLEKKQAMNRKKWGKYLLLMHFSFCCAGERDWQELCGDEWSSVSVAKFPWSKRNMLCIIILHCNKRVW